MELKEPLLACVLAAFMFLHVLEYMQTKAIKEIIKLLHQRIKELEKEHKP